MITAAITATTGMTIFAILTILTAVVLTILLMIATKGISMKTNKVRDFNLPFSIVSPKNALIFGE